MAAQMKPGELHYTGVVDCMVKIMEREGPLFLFRGMNAYFWRCAPHATIVLLSYDSFVDLYRLAFFA